MIGVGYFKLKTTFTELCPPKAIKLPKHLIISHPLVELGV